MRIFPILYNAIWTYLFTPVLPYTILIKDRHKRERLLGPSRFRARSSDNIWIHALSLGEVLSAIPLVHELNREYPEKNIVMSVSTKQGLRIAKQKLETHVSQIFTMPVDFWLLNRRTINQVNPVIFVLVETDIWPGMIHALKSRGITVFLINGRVSPRTFRMYRRFRPISSYMLNMIDLCLMQSELDRKRLIMTGVHPDRVVTTGNIKFDQDVKPMGYDEKWRWLKIFKLNDNEPVLVAGSTHPGEEELILDVFKRLKSNFPQLRLILAPRDINRAEFILNLIARKRLKGTLRSKIDSKNTLLDVIVLDSIGELGRIYGIGTVAFVGGSLVPVGGHNLLEPASFGVPVLFGPHTHNFVAMSDLLISCGGGERVKDAEELYTGISELLADNHKRRTMGKNAVEFVHGNRGALSNVMGYIRRVLS